MIILTFFDIPSLGLIAKYCILDSFVDYEGSSLSSKGFLPTVVDISLIKFAQSLPF